ncbi:hypothetical protein MCHI_000802 [Candidatus Magnetoovum chiemensis]|nr:hypothetical protein MCHI_000802 [Candidatus Magnetoovum chiemensis]
MDICDPGPPPTYEEWGDDFANLNIDTVSINALFPSSDLFLQRYVVEYTPQVFDLNLPPITKYDLTSLYVLPADGTASGLPFIIFDSGDKYSYAEDLANGLYVPTVNSPYLYDMKITFYGKDLYGTEFSFVFHRTVMVGYYYNC